MQTELIFGKYEKPLLLLRCLLRGAQVVIKEREWALGKDGSLCVKWYRKKINAPMEEYWGSVDCDIKDFIRMANDLSEVDFVTITANLTLQNMREENIARRSKHLTAAKEEPETEDE